MSETFECGDHTALVGYLYGECSAQERESIESHLAVCAACAAEAGALGATRMQLAAWAPPESDLGFRIVSEARGKVLRPARWWQQPLPAWAQAAAAALIFGAGLGLGVMNNGGATSDADAPARVAAAAETPVAVSREDLAALEQRLRAEMAQARTVAVPAAAAPAADSEARLIARVRALIDESEARQRRELAVQTTQVMRDVDAQRQFDFARVQRALGQFEGTTGVEIQRQRQDLNNLIRVSQGR